VCNPFRKQQDFSNRTGSKALAQIC
jgi:hypothetical protein